MLPEKYCDLHFNKSIDVWDEAIPLGNGDLGCLVWGKSNALRLSLDKCDIWDCTGAPVPDESFNFDNLRKLVSEGNQDEILRIFDYPYNRPTPTKLPAGKIIIDLHKSTDVVSHLSLAAAEAVFTADGISLRTFLHAEKKAGLIKINTESCDFRIENPDYGYLSDNTDDTYNPAITRSLKSLHYEAAKISAEKNNGIDFSFFTQKISEKLTYGVFLGVIKSNGKTLAAYTVAAGTDEPEIIGNTVSSLSDVLREGYEENLKQHRDWWAAFWDKSYIRIPDKFMEKNWYITNYLLGSCSRKGSYPMPLQGVWTADDGKLPPWKGDYHHDLNTELCYYSYLKANHIEEGESFIDYLLSLTDKAKAFAKDYFHADGLCLPGVMDIEGNALGGWVQYSVSPVNQAWLCRSLEKHFDYTGDMNYLREKAYPYIKESGLFILSLLEENKDGGLSLPLSSSPEIHDNRLEAWLTPDSNYDLSLMRSLFLSLVRFSGILGLASDREKWQSVLDRLGELHIDDDGVLLLSPDERLKESHRHLAHLMAIHPLKLIEYDTDEHKRIIDACIKDVQKLGTEWFCGYSFAWMAELYVVQRDGENAYDSLNTFWKYFCLPNGFHCNGDYLDKGCSSFKYRPFTLEGNFCAADALQEMLLGYEDRKIKICPAIPEGWKDISFKLRAENGSIVTASVYGTSIRQCSIETAEPSYPYK